MSPSYTLAERGRRFLCHEAWNIGVIGQPADDIVRNGVTGSVRWLPAPDPWTMLADPACRVKPDGGRVFYAEHMDYRRPLGEIWSAKIAPGADPAEARFHPLLAQPFHMSYPFPFTDDAGRAMLTAESWQAGAALLWAEEAGGLNPAGTLFPGRQAVDPTLWRGQDRWWLFCSLEDDAPNARLHLFHTPSLGQKWTPHKCNPVKSDPGSARPAGPIFRAGDLLIRPGQDCARTYGGAVVLHAIRRLDEDGFEEEPIRRIEPRPGPYPSGLHTFAPAGDVTLIDGKRWQADLPAAARKLARRLKIRPKARGRG